MAAGNNRDGVFDVAVVGAGPGGSATAAELARRGLQTILIGRGGINRPNIGECLPPSICPQLEKAGVWEEFRHAGHATSLGIRSAWGSPQLADRDFLFSPYGAGWHIDRLRFDAMLRKSALQSGARSLECVAIQNLEPIPSGWRLHLTENSERGSGQGSAAGTVDARMLIDATGRASVIARRTGAKRISLDRLTGVAGYFSARDSTPLIESVLLVEAVENGWWYSAPLPEGKLVAVFMTDADMIQRHQLTHADRWMELLGSTLHHNRRMKEHALRPEGAIRIVPAGSSFLDHVAGFHWLATGDAAAAFDPLSSQGIITAISSGLDAAETAAEWLRGDANAPAAYAQRLRRSYAEYLAHRTVYYAMENRWPESSFWKARQTPSPALTRRKEAVCA